MSGPSIIDTLAHRHFGGRHTPDEGFDRYVLRYVFGQVNSTEVAQRIRSVVGVDHRTAVAFRMGLQSSGYLMQHVKPYLFRCSKLGLHKAADCLPLAESYGVAPEDARLVLMLDHPSLRSIQSLHGFTALTARNYRRRYDSLYADLEPIATRLAWRKHRFIFQQPANGVRVEDIVHDLLAKGMQGIMVQYPRIQSRLHAKNVGIQSLRNQGNNIINHYTTQGRANLTATAEGFQATVMHVEESHAVMGAFDPELMGFESNRTLSDLLHHHSGRKRGALRAMMGLHNRAFTEWLSRNALVRHRIANDDLLDVLIERGQFQTYETYMCRWLGIEPAQLAAFKRTLREVV